MNANPKSLKDFLKKELTARDWIQADLVRESKISKSSISRYLDETDPGLPDLEEFIMISNALKIGVEILLSHAYPDQIYGTHLSADGKLVAERFDQLPKGVRNSILAIIRDAHE